jgi:hypothetical protein
MVLRTIFDPLAPYEANLLEVEMIDSGFEILNIDQISK